MSGIYNGTPRSISLDSEKAIISEAANSVIQLIIPKINEVLIRTNLLNNDLFFLLKIWNLIRPKKFI